MAPEPLPGDPTTWKDWRDPAARGLIKIDCDTALEQLLWTAAVLCAALAAIVLYDQYVEGMFRSWHRPMLPASVAPVLVMALAGGGLLFAGARQATDNFYLIDRARHIIYFHFRFLWFRRVRVRLERADVYATSVESRKRSQHDWAIRWGWLTWWEERVVFIDKRGHLVPMSNWARDSLWTANNDAKALAMALGCQCLESPDNGRLVVRVRNGSPVVSFKPR